VRKMMAVVTAAGSLLLAGAAAASPALAAASGTFSATGSMNTARLHGTATLLPDSGSWQPVAAVNQIPTGHAKQVSTASLDVVIINDGGTITAVSGVCTHLGCKLQPDDANRKLDCPCHQTAFSWSGKVLYYRLKAAPANLPQIPSRVNNGQVELYIV